MATQEKEKSKSKRPYCTDLSEKLKGGKPWLTSMKFDNDVAKAILKEKKSLPEGVLYEAIVNERLRKAYGIKKKKAA